MKIHIIPGPRGLDGEGGGKGGGGIHQGGKGAGTMATPRGGGLSQKAAPALSPPGLKLSRDKTDFIN